MDFTIAAPMRSHVSVPELISRVPAKYTDEARRAGIHGVVLLSATIDGRGRARDIEVERGLDPGLDQEAIKAVQQWRFKPGEQDGHPVRVNVHVEVTFNLLN
jgi:TonB family protein